MRLVLECLADTASVNIAERLREAVAWKATGDVLDGRPVRAHGDWRLATIPHEHIHDETLESRLPPALQNPEVVVFLSRHRAQSGTPSLTVHPIGNWGEAPYGGRPGAVVPTDSRCMGGLLRHLKAHAPAGYEVSLEATHHGPYLQRPAVFLELGSSERQWGDRDAAGVLADALVHAAPSDAPAVLWVGGGHYCPQLSDLVVRGQAAPGHMVAGWAAQAGVSDAALLQGVAGTPGCTGYLLQRKATAAERAVAARLDALGVPAASLPEA